MQQYFVVAVYITTFELLNKTKVIQNFKSLDNMKTVTKQTVKFSVVALTAFVFFSGLIYFIVDNAKREKGGYYTAQDTLKSYNRGYQDGSYDMRQIIKCERTDTTIKSCQDK